MALHHEPASLLQQVTPKLTPNSLRVVIHLFLHIEYYPDDNDKQLELLGELTT